MLDRYRHVSIALLLSLIAANAAAEPPKTVTDTICRPTFETGSISVTGS